MVTSSGFGNSYFSSRGLVEGPRVTKDWTTEERGRTPGERAREKLDSGDALRRPPRSKVPPEPQFSRPWS